MVPVQPVEIESLNKFASQRINFDFTYTDEELIDNAL